MGSLTSPLTHTRTRTTKSRPQSAKVRVQMPSLASVVYFVSWAIYGRNFNIWDMDPRGITHINYAFANIQEGRVILGDPWADKDKYNTDHGDSWSETDTYSRLHGNLHQLYRYKQKYRWIKTGISVGGWTWSGQFSTVAATPQARSRFVKSALDFVLTYGMDFVDLDWEYPVSGGLAGNARSSSDRVNFVLLLQEFKKQIAQLPSPHDRMIGVSAAISCGMETLINYDFAGMDPWIDRYNMMCYDFSGAWSPVTDHQANLFCRRSSDDCITKAVDYVLTQGASPSKIVMGMPMYGRGFAATQGLLKPFNGGGQGTWEPGIYDYKALPLPSMRQLWETTCRASFSYDPDQKLLISYDNPTATSYKMKYILDRGLGGVMFWEISADHPSDHPQSLLGMVTKWAATLFDRTPNCLCYPQSPYTNLHGECPPDTEKVHTIGSSQFLGDLKALNIEKIKIYDADYNAPMLSIPRAHYNYSDYEGCIVDLEKKKKNN